MAQTITEKKAQLQGLVQLLTDASQTVLREWDNEAQRTSSDNSAPKIPSPELFEARRIILGACGMCIDLVQDPLLRLTETALSYLPAKALYIAIEARVADILADADPLQGLHIDVIGEKTGINARKLLQVLRCLGAVHIFAEVKDYHFINTNTSQHLVNNEELLSSFLIQKQWSAATEKLPDVLFDSVKTHSTSAKEAGYVEAYGSSVWEYLEQPVQQPNGELGPRPELAMWASGMASSGQFEGPAALVDYPWSKLGASTVVDVGGGTGGMSLQLAKRFPKLRFVVQDREAVIQKAEVAWSQELPSALQAGRVQFMSHDFFTEQPVKVADVFILQRIMHDWPDDDCVTILRHLRRAMGPDSRVLIADKVVQTPAGSVFLKRAPSPLPSNYGRAQYLVQMFDLAMLALFNAGERTTQELNALAVRAQLKVVKVYECRSQTYITELRRDDYVIPSDS